VSEYDRKKFIKILEKIKSTYSSLNEMADKSEITSSYLSKIMSSKYEEPPSPKILRGIAKASHDITTYMELMYICGYIDKRDIFEYSNSVFTSDSIINCIRKSEIFDTVEAEEIIHKLEQEDYNYFYKKLEAMPENLKLKFFNTMEKKIDKYSESEIKYAELKINNKAIEIPILENFVQDMLIKKNKKIKLNMKKDIPTNFIYFANKYIKKEYDYIALIIKDNSMNLKLKKEDIILIQLQEDLKQGDIAFIEVNNEQIIRKYYKENDYIILETLSNNENFTTKIYNTKENKIKILGKVVAYQGKIV